MDLYASTVGSSDPASKKEKIEKEQSKALFSANVVVILDALAVSWGLPVIPFLVLDLGGSSVTVGSLLATFAFCNIFSSTLIGWISDKVGRRPTLLISVLGVGLSFLLNAMALNLRWLFVARASLGFWSGVGSTSRAYVADVTTPEQRTAAMGKMGGITMMCYGLGAPLGTFVAGLLNSYRTPFLLSAASCAIALPVIIFRLPDDKKLRAELDEMEAQKDKATSVSGDTSSATAVTGLLPGAVPKLILMYTYALLNVSIQAVLMVCLPLFFMSAFGWSAQVYAFAFLFFTMGSSITQMKFLKGAVNRFGRVPLGMLASIGCLAGTSLMSLSAIGVPSYPDDAGPIAGPYAAYIFVVGIGFTVCVGGFSSGITTPSISMLGGSAVQGRLMGFQGTIEVGGRMLFQIVSALLYEKSPFHAFLLPPSAYAVSLICIVMVYFLDLGAKSSALDMR